MPPQPDEPLMMMEIELTRHDLLETWVEAFGAAGEAEYKDYRSRLIQGLATLGAIAGPAVAGIAALLGVTDHRKLLTFIALGWVAFAVGSARYVSRRAIKAQWAAQVKGRLARGEYDVYVGRSVLRFDAAGISQSRPGIRDAWFAWSEVTSIDAMPAGVVARIGRLSAFIIPNRSFPAGASATEMVARMRALHEASGAGELQRLRVHFESRDVPCPSCGYNLRGAAALNCPECGQRLRLDNLPPARQ